MLIIYFVLLILGLLSSRTTLVGARGGHRDHSLTVLISLAGLGATLSLIVWGFIHLKWYWPVAAFAVGTVVAGLLVSRSSWAGLSGLRPIFDIAVIAGAVYFWFWK
jgi:hypothetical protein